MWRWILLFIPKNHLSFLFGKIAEIKLPVFLRQLIIGSFAKMYSINTEEMVGEIKDYDSLSTFFVRGLKPGRRPIAQGLVHPSDSMLTRWGHFDKGSLLQAKGKTYSFAKFLLKDPQLDQQTSGVFFNYYLCPTDYHRVHMPCDSTLNKITYVPGQLWPVNPWSVENISQLFSRNERIIFEFSSSVYGTYYYVMVGATNVGKMSISLDVDFRPSGLFGSKEPVEINLPQQLLLKAGQELGQFHLGSTVILVFTDDEQRSDALKVETFRSGLQVKMGESNSYLTLDNTKPLEP